MQIIVKLEQKDFSGIKAVFDQMYVLSDVVNKPQEIQQDESIPKNEVEQKAGIPSVSKSKDKPESKSQGAEPAEDPKYTIEMIRKAFGDLAKAKGKEAAKGLLDGLGAKKVTDLTPDKYSDAMQKIKELS